MSFAGIKTSPPIAKIQNVVASGPNVREKRTAMRSTVAQESAPTSPRRAVMEARPGRTSSQAIRPWTGPR
jgi:hypothetical protein